jgi:hypothetical protein
MRGRAGLPILVLIAVGVIARQSEPQTLVGFASLPAESFAAGPTSGQFISAANGVKPPFTNRQPVQGFSSILRTTGGDFLVMPDNGFGSKMNSADFVLRVYRISPDFKTRSGGTGTILIRSFITLHDPDRLIGFPIVADREAYPGPPDGIAVDPAVTRDRLLTGSDIDIESMREAPDGTFWFGDEFGPFLVHTDATGKLLEAPLPLAGVRSPQNPFGGTPTLGASRGFEGLALTPDGERLYPILEGPVAGDDARHLRLHEFDLRRRQFTERRWIYPLEVAAHSIGDITAVADRTFLVIERDDAQGDAARFKKIFLVNLDRRDAGGVLVKEAIVDLLNLADPDRLAGPQTRFRFPFQTIESLVVLGERDIGVLNDNNYPFSAGRAPGRTDANEFVIVHLARPLVR